MLKKKNIHSIDIYKLTIIRVMNILFIKYFIILEFNRKIDTRNQNIVKVEVHTVQLTFLPLLFCKCLVYYLVYLTVRYIIDI